MKQRKTIYDISSNQYWGGLNRRCDNRIVMLARAGYKWNKETRTFNRFVFKTSPFTMSFLTHADKRAFLSHLTH